jgi:hypothetical protein
VPWFPTQCATNACHQVLNWTTYGLYEEQLPHVLSDNEVADKKQLHNKAHQATEKGKAANRLAETRYARARHHKGKGWREARPPTDCRDRRVREQESAGASGEQMCEQRAANELPGCLA